MPIYNRPSATSGYDEIKEAIDFIAFYSDRKNIPESLKSMKAKNIKLWKLLPVSILFF